jgi:hypothetical protein
MYSVSEDSASEHSVEAVPTETETLYRQSNDSQTTNSRKFGKHKELRPQSGTATAIGNSRISTQIVSQRQMNEIVQQMRRRTEHAQCRKRGQE